MYYISPFALQPALFVRTVASHLVFTSAKKNSNVACFISVSTKLSGGDERKKTLWIIALSDQLIFMEHLFMFW